MQILEFGRHLLFLATCLSVGIVGLSTLGLATRRRRFVVSARTGFYGLFLLVAASAGCLINGFITGQYDNTYIFRYSELSLGTPFKVAGLWAGLDGSMLFWTLILTAYGAVAALQHRWSSRNPIGRRIEPWFYLVMSCVIGFFILVVYNVTNPFEVMPLEQRLAHSPDGVVPDGRGLNPQLENYWMAIHPPSLYIGLVGFTVPFAFSIAALLAGEMGDYWIKITRRWTLFTWSFLTFGIVLGGLWAYEMLGWGGYWAWDPVENASILPWFVGTAFLHSVLVQERRDMLKGWNIFLIVLTFFMTIIATYMTRSGVVDSIHAFADGEVGNYFLPFMIGIVVISAFVMGLRAPFLRGKHKLESFFSREAAFFFNNLILVALMLTVYLLSMFGKISHDFLLAKRSAREVTYNLVTTPLFLMLLLLTGIGPQLGWVKTSPKVFLKRVLWPSVISAVVCLALLPVWWTRDTLPPLFGGEPGIANAAAPVADAAAGAVAQPAAGSGTFGWRLIEKAHWYSLLVGLGFSVFILSTVWAELWRGVASRMRHRGDPNFLVAALRVIFGNNRRYGGYIVHVGIAFIAIGVIWSSCFRVKEDMTLEREKPTQVADSEYKVTWVEREELPAGTPYTGEKLRFDIHKGDRRVASLWPELRHYPKNTDSPLVSIPAIERNFIDDYYIHYSYGQQMEVSFTIFINPLVNWIWFGTVVILLGGLFAALPMPRKRIGLAG